MQQHIGAAARPVVGAGDSVSVGDLIAEIPSDALGANLHASITGRVSQVGETVQSWLTFNDLAMVALAAWILFVFLVILFGTARGRRTGAAGAGRRVLQYALVVSAVVLVVGALALGSALAAEPNRAEGVIVAETVDVSSGPGVQYIAEFTLHGGAEVSLVETRGSWVRLALPGGELEGWVPANAVEAVGRRG